MSYSIDDLSTLLDLLTQRVSELDGQGLVSPNIGAINNIKATDASLQLDINQTVLSFQELLLGFQTAFNNAVNRLNTLTNTPMGTGTINLIK